MKTIARFDRQELQSFWGNDSLAIGSEALEATFGDFLSSCLKANLWAFPWLVWVTGAFSAGVF